MTEPVIKAVRLIPQDVPKVVAALCGHHVALTGGDLQFILRKVYPSVTVLSTRMGSSSLCDFLLIFDDDQDRVLFRLSR